MCFTLLDNKTKCNIKIGGHMPAKELLNEVTADLQRNDDDIGQDVPVKPPVGVVPRYIRDIERMEELCRGIHHYIAHKQEPDREWIQELHELLSRYLNHLHFLERQGQTRP